MSLFLRIRQVFSKLACTLYTVHCKFHFHFTVWFCVFVRLISPVSSKGQCVDGTYAHQDRQCCLCALGKQLVEHCTENLHYGKCEPCENGKYSNHPSNDKSCEHCTSCSHPNENLEEDEPCTPSSDAKCRCKKDHYCVSSVHDICTLCHPCEQCGAEGVKIPCAGRNNTVCNEKIEAGPSGGEIFGIVMGVLFVIALLALACWFIWRQRKSRSGQPLDPNNLEQQPIRVTEIPDVDLEPLLDNIATVIGWNDMQKVARLSKMPQTAVDACRLNNPENVEEATVKLLGKWVEREGRGAPTKLIEHLEKSIKKQKADKVRQILLNAGEN